MCARTPARPAAARASKRAAVWDGRAGVQAPHATRAQLSWPPDTLHARDTTANVRSRSRQPLRGESAALPCVLCAVAARVSRRVLCTLTRTTAAAHSLAIGATFTSATWRDARDEKFHAKAARDDLFSLSRATTLSPITFTPAQVETAPVFCAPNLRSTKRTCVILYHVWSTQHIAPRVGPARAIPAHGRTVLTASGVVVRSLILLGKKIISLI